MMRNFDQIAVGINAQTYLEELSQAKDAWAISTGRQQKIAVQREALSIPIRGLRKSAINNRKRRDVHESRWTTASEQFPKARAFLEYWAGEAAATVGRAKIVCLPAGRRVYPHIDRGDYYRLHDRYHLVLKSSSGSWLKAGDEEIRMQEGELWWFDNNEVHEAFNDGDEDRIHLIFDMLPQRHFEEAFGMILEKAA